MSRTFTQNFYRVRKETLEEKIENLWNYIAKVWAVDADNEADIDTFRSREDKWMVEDFEYNLKEYKELKAQLNA